MENNRSSTVSLSNIPYPTAKKGIVVKKLVLIIIGIVIFILAFVMGRFSTGPTSSTAIVSPPTQLKTLNKDFIFPIKDQNDKQISTMTYTIINVETQKDIIVAGQPAHAVNGRTFLVINLKISNPSPQSIQLNSRDFVRVSINKNDEMLAPDIYNDPITVQAISTAYTRLGLAIDDNTHQVTLHVGEINGPKTDIPINL